MIDKELLLDMQQKFISSLDVTKDISDAEIERNIEEEVLKLGHHQYISLNDRLEYKHLLFNSIRGLGILQDYVDNDDITEIMVIGHDKIFIEKNGRILETDSHFSSNENLLNIIQQIASISNRSVNEASPIVDARLKDGSRVNIVLPPIALDGAIVTIRKFPKNHLTMNQLIQYGSISASAANFLNTLVFAGYNIFISGGTGSGKTTFLNVLSNAIPSDSRVVTIEDSAELKITNIKNLVRLETRQANRNGIPEITIRDLIKASLRMRPDRIIVGECRGFEALDMLQAMNTGHDGSMSTGHGNSTKDMLERIETMVLMGSENLPSKAIKRQIASAIDIIVHLGRLPDKSRHVLEISEICEIKNDEIILNKLYVYDHEKTHDLIYTGNTLHNTFKLSLVNIGEISYEL